MWFENKRGLSLLTRHISYSALRMLSAIGFCARSSVRGFCFLLFSGFSFSQQILLHYCLRQLAVCAVARVPFERETQCSGGL
jgi:hypothetical protein